MTIWDNAPKNSQLVFEHLRLLAKRMRVETYGQIAKAIEEKEERRIAPLSIRYPLGFIRDEICRPRGLPWLNAPAVSGNDWLPGDSFLPQGAAFGEDERILWRGMALAVFAYAWELVE